MPIEVCVIYGRDRHEIVCKRQEMKYFLAMSKKIESALALIVKVYFIYVDW